MIKNSNDTALKNILKNLHQHAIAARLNSHSPYSKYKVGAAILLSTGEIFSGCNIENASYGGTVCAERVAVWKAASEKGAIEISQVMVVTDSAEAWPPCGFCRQVIAEFATDKTQVHTANLEQIQKTFLFSELLPESFNPKHLGK